MADVVVFKGNFEVAKWAVSLLREHGIDAEIPDSPNINAYQKTWFAYVFRVTVEESRADEAKQVIYEANAAARPRVREIERALGRLVLKAAVFPVFILVASFVVPALSGSRDPMLLLVSWGAGFVLFSQLEKRNTEGSG